MLLKPSMSATATAKAGDCRPFGSPQPFGQPGVGNGALLGQVGHPRRKGEIVQPVELLDCDPGQSRCRAASRASSAMAWSIELPPHGRADEGEQGCRARHPRAGERPRSRRSSPTARRLRGQGPRRRAVRARRGRTRLAPESGGSPAEAGDAHHAGRAVGHAHPGATEAARLDRNAAGALRTARHGRAPAPPVRLMPESTACIRFSRCICRAARMRSVTSPALRAPGCLPRPNAARILISTVTRTACPSALV